MPSAMVMVRGQQMGDILFGEPPQSKVDGAEVHSGIHADEVEQCWKRGRQSELGVGDAQSVRYDEGRGPHDGR